MMAVGACAPFRTMLAEQESRAHLQQLHQFLRQEDFAAALQANQQVLSLAPKKAPGDAALFGMGLVHAHPAYAKKDYRRARSFFSQIDKDFPGSPLAEEAKIWAGVLEATSADQERRAHLQGALQLMQQGDFEGAQRASQKVLSHSPKSPPGDAALFSMGLLHIHYGNPLKDYRKAQSFFVQLQKEFPRSPLAEEAKVWVGVLGAMERAMQIDIEIEEKKKELTR